MSMVEMHFNETTGSASMVEFWVLISKINDSIISAMNCLTKSLWEGTCCISLSFMSFLGACSHLAEISLACALKCEGLFPPATKQGRFYLAAAKDLIVQEYWMDIEWFKLPIHLSDLESAVAALRCVTSFLHHGNNTLACKLFAPW